MCHQNQYYKPLVLMAKRKSHFHFAGADKLRMILSYAKKSDNQPFWFNAFLPGKKKPNLWIRLGFDLKAWRFPTFT
jgi:hypothetical protein